jgi:asparagine synthase (glutamine-hydrolysing)
VFRYLAFTWNEEDESQRQTASLLQSKVVQQREQWRTALSCPGVSVFTTGETPGVAECIRLGNGDAVLLGTVFEQWPTDSQEEGTPGQPRFDPERMQQIITCGARTLTQTCWGRYVAVVHDRAARRTWILRDPSGGLPCLHTTFRGTTIFYSRIQDFAALGLSRLSVNWEYLAAHLIAWLIEARETGLVEVSSLPAGECLEANGAGISRRTYWHPPTLAAEGRLDDPLEAASALRLATRRCVRGWADRYGAILHRLSGGLDSSIVLSCLSSSGRNVHCLNYFSEGSNTDERRYARLAAGRSRIPLIERRRDSQVRLDKMLDITPAASPSDYIGCLTSGRAIGDVARELKVSVITSGSGGDQLFYQQGAAFAIADLLERHGPRKGFARAVLDAARMEELSIWRVLRQATQELRRTSGWDPLRDLYPYRKMVNPGLVEALKTENRYLHPWFSSGPSAPPGKRWQLHWLSFPKDFYDPLQQPGDPDRVAPLLSQPLMEVCIRIPSYVLIAGGRDRAIARRAFRGDVPEEILQRRAKGGMEEHAKELLARNITFVRGTLLEGNLARLGLIDRAKLEQALSSRPHRVDSVMAEIFAYLGTEIWLGKIADMNQSLEARLFARRAPFGP